MRKKKKKKKIKKKKIKIIISNHKIEYTLINKEFLNVLQTNLDKINENLIQLQIIESDIKSKSKEKFKEIISEIVLKIGEIKKEIETTSTIQQENISKLSNENDQNSIIGKNVK